MCKIYIYWLLLVLFTKVVNLKAQDTIVITTENVAQKYDCFSPKKSNEVLLIKNVADGKANLSICNNIFADDTLNVDFISHDILFCTIRTNGSVDEFKYNLYKIPKEKKYLLLVRVKHGILPPDNLVIRRIIELTPKLDADYIIEYKKIETYAPVPSEFIKRN